MTRLRTLRRSADQSGHRELKGMVDQIMHDLHPDNCARISLKEFELHNKYDDCWLLIDGRIYDVTSFMDVHPGGGELKKKIGATIVKFTSKSYQIRQNRIKRFSSPQILILY